MRHQAAGLAMLFEIIATRRAAGAFRSEKGWSAVHGAGGSS